MCAQGRLKSACASALSDQRHPCPNKETASLASQNTLQPLYNTVRYNTVLDITRFKDGSQTCLDYIEKRP